MKKHNILSILLFISIVLLLSCKSNTKEIKTTTTIIAKDTAINKKVFIVKIAFATGGCEGTCPLEAFQIDTSLNVLFFGGMHSKKEGFYVGKIQKELWEQLILKVDSFSPFRYDDKYNRSKDDLIMQMVFCYKDKNKNIVGQKHDLPEDFIKLFYWMDSKLRKVKLTTIDSMPNFETNIQCSEHYKKDKLKKKL